MCFKGHHYSEIVMNIFKILVDHTASEDLNYRNAYTKIMNHGLSIVDL